MSSKIVVNVQTHITRIALLEDEKLVELLVEYPDAKRIVGNIYKGKVERVLPGIQSVFVDIGLEKKAFLHISDVSTDAASSPDVSALFRNGDEILVKVIKEPRGTKGPRVTTRISIAGRYLVLIPHSTVLGVSRKIHSARERFRLRKIAREFAPGKFGIIIRTIAEGKKPAELRRDFSELIETWERLQVKIDKSIAPTLIYRDAGFTESIVRDIFSSDVDEMVLDSRTEYERIHRYIKETAPNLASKLIWYNGKQPIFDHYGIEPEIEKIFVRKLQLKKGVSIVIDHTEALTAIDVNSGGYLGKGRDKERTILETNLIAAREIARQIRLRDIGGLIIIDFIDMESRESRRAVYQDFKKSLKSDRAKFSILPISDFGLVEMTRQRVRPGLFEQTTEPCPYCSGLGRILSPDTVIAQIERYLLRLSDSIAGKDITLVVHPNIACEMLADNAQLLHEFRRSFKSKFDVLSDITLNPSEFKVINSATGDELK
ncbi:MAG: hypothetical protein B6D65_01620 [candidate division Zixibacteria bacterium 4484_93]|nr:MAG: hypothetical protein B6D65_01620 [candidate division Zixibacteria bacterium 4484_93]